MDRLSARRDAVPTMPPRLGPPDPACFIVSRPSPCHPSLHSKLYAWSTAVPKTILCSVPYGRTCPTITKKNGRRRVWPCHQIPPGPPYLPPFGKPPRGDGTPGNDAGRKAPRPLANRVVASKGMWARWGTAGHTKPGRPLSIKGYHALLFDLAPNLRKTPQNHLR